MVSEVSNQEQLDELRKRKADLGEIHFKPGRYLFNEFHPQTFATFCGFGAHVELYGLSGCYYVQGPTVHCYGSGELTLVEGEVEASNYFHIHAYHGRVKAAPSVIVEAWGKDVVVEGGMRRDRSRQPGIPVEEWMQHYNLTLNDDGSLTVYKGVNYDYMSKYGWSYRPGETPRAPDWNDTPECGGGLHFSPTPTLTRLYTHPSRFMACRINPEDSVPLGDKIKSWRVLPPGCVEVDVFGVPCAEQ